MMPRRAALPLLFMISACGKGGGDATPAIERDPAVVAALNDPIMIDPDLASQNRGNAAITLDSFAAVPLDDVSPDAIAAAQADAARLAGGILKSAPEPIDAGAAARAAVTAGQFAATMDGTSPGCIQGLRYGYAWAATFRPQLPIYPRGHVQEAAGNEACRLRAAVFTTPVEPQAVMDFYFTLASDAGYRTERRRAGEVELLSGRKAGAVFVVRARHEGALTEVELAVRG